MRKKLSNQSGFTFVELVMAMALFSLVLLALTAGVIQLFKIYQSGLGVRNTQQAARLISDDVTRTAREAAVFEIGTANQPISVRNGSVNLAHDTLCFYADTARSQGTIYYTEGSANRYRLVRAYIANPACSRAFASSPHVMTSTDTSILKFDLIRGANPLQNRLVNLDMIIVAATATSGPDLERVGATDVTCFGQVGSQWCSITKLKAGSALRLYK